MPPQTPKKKDSPLDKGLEKAGQALGNYLAPGSGKLVGKAAKSGVGKWLIAFGILSPLVGPAILVMVIAMLVTGGGGGQPQQANCSNTSTTGSSLFAGGGGGGGAAGGGGDLNPSGPDWAQTLNKNFPGIHSDFGQTGPRISHNVIAALAESAGKTTGIPVPGETMAQVTEGESSRYPGNVQGVPVSNGYGLWQETHAGAPDNPNEPIGEYHSEAGMFGWTYKDMLNPIKAALAMAFLFKKGGISQWYGTGHVTSQNAHYSGPLPLVNLYQVLGIKGPNSGGGTSSDFVSNSSGGASCSGGSSQPSFGQVSTVPGNKVTVDPQGNAHPPADAPKAVQNVVEAADAINQYPYSWGGGHCSNWPSSLDDTANWIKACGGSGNHDNGGGPGPGFDCSGSVAFALGMAGLAQKGYGLTNPGGISSEFDNGPKGPGKWITVFSNSQHVYMKVAGAWFNTENGAWGNHPPLTDNNATH
ncbi:MAG: hypothetical protein J2P17_27050, partial [Mycobacterium sp.]|nr:hypothetical protein [Mycobacterium sp.]